LLCTYVEDHMFGEHIMHAYALLQRRLASDRTQAEAGAAGAHLGSSEIRQQCADGCSPAAGWSQRSRRRARRTCRTCSSTRRTRRRTWWRTPSRRSYKRCTPSTSSWPSPTRCCCTPLLPLDEMHAVGSALCMQASTQSQNKAETCALPSIAHMFSTSRAGLCMLTSGLCAPAAVAHGEVPGGQRGKRCEQAHHHRFSDPGCIRRNGACG